MNLFNEYVFKRITDTGDTNSTNVRDGRIYFTAPVEEGIRVGYDFNNGLFFLGSPEEEAIFKGTLVALGCEDIKVRRFNNVSDILTFQDTRGNSTYTVYFFSTHAHIKNYREFSTTHNYDVDPFSSIIFSA